MKYIIIFITFLSNISLSQSINSNKTIYLIEQSEKYYQVDFFKCLKYSSQAAVIAKKNNDSKNIAKAQFYIASSLVYFGKCKESILNVDSGLKEKYVIGDDKLRALLKITKGKSYSRLYLSNEQIREYRESLNIVSKINDTESQIIKSLIYMLISDYHLDNDNSDSANIFINKSIKLINDIPLNEYKNLKKIYHIKSQIYYYKASGFQKERKIDSAIVYFNKSNEQAIFDNIRYNKYNYLNGMGDCYAAKKNYKKALECYIESLEEVNKIGKTNSEISMKISKLYSYFGDNNSAKKYIEQSYRDATAEQKYSRLQNKAVVELLITNKNNHLCKKIKFIIFIPIILLLIFALIIYKLKKILKRKSYIILEKETRLREKIKIISDFEDKINGSFEEILNMAKNNNPQFLTRFQEVYPNFFPILLENNPKLRISELSFCAYVYLGFTTKEIANYTFKSIKTIENNRYNIRKRLALHPEQDLYLWLKNTTNNSNH